MITVNVQVNHPQAAHRKVWKLTNPTKYHSGDWRQVRSQIFNMLANSKGWLQNVADCHNSCALDVPWQAQVAANLASKRGYAPCPPLYKDAISRITLKFRNCQPTYTQLQKVRFSRASSSGPTA